MKGGREHGEGREEEDGRKRYKVSMILHKQYRSHHDDIVEQCVSAFV